jgi:hypothetical protein
VLEQIEEAFDTCGALRSTLGGMSGVTMGCGALNRLPKFTKHGRPATFRKYHRLATLAFNHGALFARLAVPHWLGEGLAANGLAAMNRKPIGPARAGCDGKSSGAPPVPQR